MTRSELRAAMPEVAKFVDATREYFPDARVTYASENGIEQGKRGPVGVIPVIEKRLEHLAVAKSKQQTKPKDQLSLVNG